MVSSRSWRPKGFRIAELTREELEKAASTCNSHNQLIQILGFADSDISRVKLKQRLLELSIDVTHFRSSKRAIAPDHIVRERRKKANNEAKAKLSLQRKDPAYRAKFILQDSRKKDKKAGFGEMQLSLQEIENIINTSCIYCGETNLMMTLDRIDNTKGHIKDNVNPCCIRCNMFKRDMPYEAWLEIIPYLKQAKEGGKFGSWVGGCKI